MYRHNLESLPAEMILEIFDWMCWDEIDLKLLVVSKRLRSIVLMHPLVQAIEMFGIQETSTGVAVVRRNPTDMWQKQLGHPCTVPLHITHDVKVSELLKGFWCNPPNAARLQAALLRTMISVHWMPYLRRDLRLDQPGARQELLTQITEICQRNGEVGQMYSLADTVDKYSWTRLQVWPTEGRALIRDQASNTIKVLRVEVVRLINEVRVN